MCHSYNVVSFSRLTREEYKNRLRTEEHIAVLYLLRAKHL